MTNRQIKDSVDRVEKIVSVHDRLLRGNDEGDPGLLGVVSNLGWKVNAIVGLITSAVAIMMASLFMQYVTLQRQSLSREISLENQQLSQQNLVATQEALQKTDENKKLIKEKVIPKIDRLPQTSHAPEPPKVRPPPLRHWWNP